MTATEIAKEIESRTGQAISEQAVLQIATALAQDSIDDGRFQPDGLAYQLVALAEQEELV